MPPPTTIDPELVAKAEALLEQVTLDYFTVEPTSVEPFASSLLRWNVDGPDGFRVDLNSTIVANTGTRTVQPRSTTIYSLHASDTAGYARKFLASRTVNVDLARCVPVTHHLFEALLYEALVQGISEHPDLYFRRVPTRDEFGNLTYPPSRPQVIMTTGQVRFILKLGVSVDYFFDATVDIDVSFGLDVLIPDSAFGLRRVVPVSVRSTVSASPSWLAWLVPGAIFWLPFKISNAEEKGQQSMAALISLFVDTFIVGWLPVPDGMEPHSVRIDPGFFGNSFVEVTFCPAPQIGILTSGPG